jgi:hypothetical protein
MTYACAFCGEENDTFVDPGGGARQVYTEDCAVCCRPNLITVTLDPTATYSSRSRKSTRRETQRPILLNPSYSINPQRASATASAIDLSTRGSTSQIFPIVS